MRLLKNWDAYTIATLKISCLLRFFVLLINHTAETSGPAQRLERMEVRFGSVEC